MVQSFFYDFLVPLNLAPVRGLHQDLQLHWPHLSLEHAIVFDFVARTGSPGEIVDVIAVVSHSLSLVGIDDTADFDAARAHDFILWHGQLDVIDAKVSEEFRHGMVLMAIPRVMPPHADFGKPLSAQDEIALPTRACLRLRHLVVECNFELHVRPGSDGLG